MRIALRAHAKINLALRVLGRRPDGYHELRTVFQSLALHDTVTVESTTRPFEIGCEMPGVPLDRTNLVWQAADAVWRAAGRRGAPSGARVRLVKRIPPQSGLGGGSSNGAAALVALNRVWRVGLGPTHLLELAAALGSDVPFFLVGGIALGLGRGEVLFPLRPLPPRWVVVARPPFGVSTADAYRWLAESRQQSAEVLPPQRLEARGYPGGLEVTNDLEPPVLARYPAVAAARRSLVDAGAEAALLCGSGSAVFGMFGARDRAARAARRLAQPGWRLVLTRTAAAR